MADKNEGAALVKDVLWPALKAERARLDRIDRWYRWDHDKPHSPRGSTTREYKQLSERSQTPWLALVVTTVAQQLYVEGYRRARDPENLASWDWWQANRFDSRQIAVHRAALAYGVSYVSVLPGETLTGQPMPVMRGHSPRRMTAFYEDLSEDEWPRYALSAEAAKINGAAGWVLRLYDDQAVHRFHADASVGSLTYVTSDEHDLGVCPIVRYANMLDLEGRSDGEVEPFIPVAARIDQTTFDRLVVQRFSSWVVRTISGMAKPEGTDEEIAARKLRLMVEDILVAEDAEAKFGSLPATPLDGFIKAKDADIRDLGAVTQTPPSHLLGDIANLSAEALAAAEIQLTRKVTERQHSFGESHEQVLRLNAYVMDDDEGADDYSAEVRWRDMESKSLSQAADALGKIADQLHVPVEMLWEKIPDWTDQDVQRAKALVEQAGGMDELLRRLADSVDPAGELNA